MKTKQQPKTISVKAMTSHGLRKFFVLEGIRPKVGERGVYNSMLYAVIEVEGSKEEFKMKVQSYKDIEILSAKKDNLSKFHKLA